MNKEIIIALIKRFFSSIIILISVISFLFVLLRIAPGDPSQKFISPELSPQLVEKVKESFNLNSSIWSQYKEFVINSLRGDFGISYKYRQPVFSVIKEPLLFTALFSFISFTIQVIAAFYLALFSVRKINGFIDKTISNLSIIIFAIPSFVIGVFLLFFFSALLKIFPSSGLTSLDFDSLNIFEQILDYTKHLFLPIITLSLGGIAVFYKYLRDNLEETLNKPFVLFLKANGVEEKQIIKKHVIPNAIGPFISVAGVELGLLFSGALITEVIFSLPGMGRLTINAILSRDYPLVLGCTFVSGFMVVLSNLAADLIKSFIDKRLLKGLLN